MKWSGAVALLVLTLSVQDNRAPAASDIAAHIETELKAARVPGAAVAIVAGDERLARGYGIAAADTGVPVDANTVVHIGSLTKLFTALAVIRALESRDLSADAAVGAYVRGLHERTARATFHHLLSQTSGLRDRAGNDGPSVETALGDAARELGPADFLLPPGTVFSYSNLGYSLAGAALEGLHQRPYADAMRELLFQPLGMTRSTIRLPVAIAGAHAVGHRLDGDKPTVVRPIANDTRIWPAGYMWSSANDMSRALFALIHHGRIDNKDVIPPSVVARAMSPHTPMPNVFVGGHYGYGLMMARDRGVMIYEHGGTLPGFSSILRFAPQRQVGIAILSNLDNAPLRRIAQSVLAKALALPNAPPAARTDAPVTTGEMKDFLGQYRNRGTATLAVRDGQVSLRLDEGPLFAVHRLEGNRFLARPAPNVPGPEFVLEPARANTPAYLHFALWAYVKE